eukprot:1642297-Lingulodinium_polyedra.AAC.1
MMMKAIAKHVGKNEDREVDLVIQQITAWLKQHPDQVKAVRIACLSGFFDKPASLAHDLKVIPPSNTRVDGLSQKFVQYCLEEMTNRFDKTILAKIKKAGGKFALHHMFCFGGCEKMIAP